MNTKYFNGTEELKGGLWTLRNAEFAAKFPGVKGVKSDSFAMLTIRNEQGEFPVTRIIYRKANPSLHKCDARCRHAKGRNCECSCGGKFHGAGE